jgi:hypothetical protein
MTPTQRAAAERLAEFESLPRKLLDIACRVRVNECLFHDDEFVDDASHTLKEALALLRELLAEPVINQQMTTELAEPVQEPVGWLNEIDGEFEHSHKPWMDNPTEEWHPVYAAPQQRKPLKTAMEAEIECDCLVAWNASTYGHSAHDTVHPMFLSAFIRGYRAAERAHGITGAPT